MTLQITLPPIWVINLKRSADRRRYITQHLNELGLPYELIDAVDGRELTPQEVAAVYNPELAVAHIRRELVPGEIGCCLSHLKLYERMIAENVEEALILEDDVVIHPDFLEIIKRKADFPQDWELMLLYEGNNLDSFWKRRGVYKHYQFVRFAGMPSCTVGYLIKQNAARKLLLCAYPLRAPIDWLTGGEIRAGISLYGVKPHCMQQLFADDPNFTTMPERDMLKHNLWPAVKMNRQRLFWNHCKWRLGNLYTRLNPKNII